MFDFSMLQQLFGGGNGQGLLGAYGGQQPGMPGYGPNVGNPYAMGIPTQPQDFPYTQQSPYTQGSPYTQTGGLAGLPSFQNYFSPFQDLRQQWQGQNALDYVNSQQPANSIPGPIPNSIPSSGLNWGWGDSPNARFDDQMKQDWYRTQSH